MTFGELTTQVLGTLWGLITSLGEFSTFIFNIFVSFPSPFNFFFGLFAVYLIAMLFYKIASFIAKFVPFLG